MFSDSFLHVFNLDGQIPVSRKVLMSVEKFADLVEDRKDILIGPSQRGLVVEFRVPESFTSDGSMLFRHGGDFQHKQKFKEHFEEYIKMLFEKNI